MRHDIGLEKRILNDIQDLFVNIRFFASSKCDESLKECIKIIEEKRALVNYFSTGFQKAIFMYCFDSLKLSIETQQYEYIFDFADAVHNLPEIFLHEYNLKQYWKTYIEPLRRKHSKQLFIQFKEIFKGMNTNFLSK